MSVQPLFTERATATLDRVESTFVERGNQYSDTWRSCRWYQMKAVAKEFGMELSDDTCRLLGLAAFCDMKYERMAGGYKDDHLIDGIAYQAVLAEEMRRLAK